jgi:acyl-CoA reductase-like NAD-dependent aldehyde dehydrogenase
MPPTEATSTSTSPYSGKVFARVPTGGPQDAAAAIQAAAEAFPAWAATPPAERARLLLKAGEIVKRRRIDAAILTGPP